MSTPRVSIYLSSRLMNEKDLFPVDVLEDRNSFWPCRCEDGNNYCESGFDFVGNTVEGCQLRDFIYEAIEPLSFDEKRILVLKMFFELDDETISMKMNCDPELVEQLVQEAMIKSNLSL